MRSITAPPEITSALVHSGPGPSSLVEASQAWRQLGITLDESADSYVSALSALVENWRGRSAVAMVQAAEPYLAWLRNTAQQCRRIAASAQRAATAFESVRAAMTPTAAITANRTQRLQLLASNRFGSNSAAIAENESNYLSMWTNNTAAMTRYQAASAQATALPTFSSPAAASAATSAAASPADTTAPSSFDPNAGWTGLANTYANQFVSSGFPINLLSYLAQNSSAQALQGVDKAMAAGLSEGESVLIPTMPLGSLGGLGALGAAGLSAMPEAAIGAGVKIGPLTAPPAIAGFLPAAQTPVQLASTATPLPAQANAFSGLPPIMPPVIPPATAAAGSGWRKRKQQKYEDLEVGLELRGPVMPKPPSAG